jgi:hypothetical protein
MNRSQPIISLIKLIISVISRTMVRLMVAMYGRSCPLFYLHCAMVTRGFKVRMHRWASKSTWGTCEAGKRQDQHGRDERKRGKEGGPCRS